MLMYLLNMLVVQLLLQELLLALHDLRVLVVNDRINLRGHLPFQVLVDVADGVMYIAHFHFLVACRGRSEAKRGRHDHI